MQFAWFVWERDSYDEAIAASPLAMEPSADLVIYNVKAAGWCGPIRPVLRTPADLDDGRLAEHQAARAVGVFQAQIREFKQGPQGGNLTPTTLRRACGEMDRGVNGCYADRPSGTARKGRTAWSGR